QRARIGSIPLQRSPAPAPVAEEADVMADAGPHIAQERPSFAAPTDREPGLLATPGDGASESPIVDDDKMPAAAPRRFEESDPAADVENEVGHVVISLGHVACEP